MQGRIEQTKPSQSGKTIGVLINGTWYSSKDFGLAQQVGKIIEFMASTQSFPNGGSVTWLNDPKIVADGGMPSPAPSNGTQHKPVSNGDIGYSQYQPMVSNLAAHLIDAGQSPDQLPIWFGACRACLEGSADLNDNIPF